MVSRIDARTALALADTRARLMDECATRAPGGLLAVSALAAQIAQTVGWRACMDNIHARQVGCVLEIGPGAALARMWNQRFADVPARSVDEFRSASAIVDWVMRNDRG